MCCLRKMLLKCLTKMVVCGKILEYKVEAHFSPVCRLWLRVLVSKQLAAMPLLEDAGDELAFFVE